LRDLPIVERTVPELLRDRARELGDAPYLLFEDQTFSYRAMYEQSRRAAGALAELGVSRGDRVVLMMDNSPDYLWILLGLGLLSAVGVPLNTAAKGAQLAYYIQDADPSHIIVDQQYEDVVKQARKSHARLVSLSDAHPGEDSDVTSYSRVLHRAEAIEPSSSAFNDLFLIMYTSGTTGPSKGVMCPHSHPLSVARYFSRGMHFTPDDRLYASQPLFHGAALWWGCFTAIWAGSSIAIARRFSASKFWEDVCRTKATQFSAVMSMVAILQKQAPTEAERNNPARQGFVIPVPRPRLEFEQRVGVVTTTNYAMTELHPVALLGPADGGYDKEGTAGRICDHDEVVIADDDGIPLPAGEVGEILVRPREPWTFTTGYWRKPEATVNAWQNLWFHTGDLASIDDDKYMFFQGRKKDAIRRRGENVSAYEVEEVLRTLDGIADCAVVGVPSELGEEDIVAYVVRRSRSLDEERVVRYASDNMAYYMVPRYVKFVDQLPQTESFKIKKYELREDAAGSRDSIWDLEKSGLVVDRTGVHRI
jgi:crotonobetaine/carnitine-CoA ligase